MFGNFFKEDTDQKTNKEYQKELTEDKTQTVLGKKTGSRWSHSIEVKREDLKPIKVKETFLE